MSLVHKSANMSAIAAGEHTTVAASDSVTTGLRKVVYAMAQLKSDPVLTAHWCTVVVPDQVASPGKITIKTWMATATGDVTPIAATTFSKVVNWFAIGE